MELKRKKELSYIYPWNIFFNWNILKSHDSHKPLRVSCGFRITTQSQLTSGSEPCPSQPGKFKTSIMVLHFKLLLPLSLPLSPSISLKERTGKGNKVCHRPESDFTSIKVGVWGRKWGSLTGWQMECVLNGVSQNETSPSDTREATHLYGFQIFTSEMR